MSINIGNKSICTFKTSCFYYEYIDKYKKLKNKFVRLVSCFFFKPQHIMELSKDKKQELDDLTCALRQIPVGIDETLPFYKVIKNFINSLQVVDIMNGMVGWEDYEFTFTITSNIFKELTITIFSGCYDSGVILKIDEYTEICSCQQDPVIEINVNKIKKIIGTDDTNIARVIVDIFKIINKDHKFESDSLVIN